MDDDISLNELINQLNKKNNFKSAKKVLDRLIKTNERRPSLVFQCVEIIVKTNGNMGDQIWDMFEEICLSSLDIGDLNGAKIAVNKLDAKFPESQRVARLKGILFESELKYNEANKIYDEILKENPSNQLINYRKITMLKMRNKIPEAIKALNTYLENFQGDNIAWQELGELYLSIGEYQYAIFCYEELILSDPLNGSFHCRLGEIHYTAAGNNNSYHFRLARQYFSQSLDLLKSNNIRATLGLAQTCQALASCKSGRGDLDVTNGLHEWSSIYLNEQYSSRQTDILPFITNILENQINNITNPTKLYGASSNTESKTEIITETKKRSKKRRF